MLPKYTKHVHKRRFGVLDIYRKLCETFKTKHERTTYGRGLNYLVVKQHQHIDTTSQWRAAV